MFIFSKPEKSVAVFVGSADQDVEEDDADDPNDSADPEFLIARDSQVC